MNKLNLFSMVMLLFMVACGSKTQNTIVDETINDEIVIETTMDSIQDPNAVVLFQDSAYQDSINAVLSTDTMTSVNGLLNALSQQ